MNRIIQLVVLITLLGALGACGKSTSTPTASPPTAIASATPAPVTATAAPASVTPVAASDIISTLTTAGDFTTLLAAVKAADLVEKLQSPGPFTLFAPTDAAFAALPTGAMDQLMANPQGDLTDIVLYHLVAKEKLSVADLAQTQTITTVLGDQATITVTGAVIKIDAATIITPDISASNGMIQVIDKVLIPPSVHSISLAPQTPAGLPEGLALAHKPHTFGKLGEPAQ